jgi:hypothetical protein
MMTCYLYFIFYILYLYQLILIIEIFKMNFIQHKYANGKEATQDYYNRENEFDNYIEEQLTARDSKSQTGSRTERGYVTLNNAGDMNESFNLIKEKGGYNNYAKEATKNIHSDSNLSRVYFSKENIDLLQDMVRYQVYEQSNRQHVVERQSDTELEVIMRHFYLTYGRNQPDRITEQVAELNTYVVNECVPMILSSVEQYLAYRLRISQQPVPLARSINLSSKGEKQLQPNHWL